MVKLLLYGLKGTAAFVGPCDIIDDVVKLANRMLSPPYIETLVVASIAQLLLKSSKTLSEQQRFDNEINGMPLTA